MTTDKPNPSPEITLERVIEKLADIKYASLQDALNMVHPICTQELLALIQSFIPDGVQPKPVTVEQVISKCHHLEISLFEEGLDYPAPTAEELKELVSQLMADALFGHGNNQPSQPPQSLSVRDALEKAAQLADKVHIIYKQTKEAHERNSKIPFDYKSFGFNISEVAQSKAIAIEIRSLIEQSEPYPEVQDYSFARAVEHYDSGWRVNGVWFDHEPSKEEIDKAYAKPPEVQGEAVCIENDGCPTEKAVLQRFWREQQPASQVDLVALAKEAGCRLFDNGGAIGATGYIFNDTATLTKFASLLQSTQGQGITLDLVTALQMMLDDNAPLTGNPSHEELIEFWTREKELGRGSADAHLAAHRAIINAELSTPSTAKSEDARDERLEDCLHRIKQWCEAYPLDVFPEPDLKLAREGLKSVGITLDAVSASNMRHVLKGIQEIVDAAMKSEGGAESVSVQRKDAQT